MRPFVRVELDDLTHVRDGSSVTSSVLVRIGDREHRLWLRTSADEASELLDPFVALTIIPAMKLGGPLILRGPVSTDLLAGLDRVQRLWQIWRRDPYQPLFPYAWRVEIEADQVVRAPSAGPGRATFFSGGVDSFHTLRTAREGLDRLLYVDRFEMGASADRSNALSANARAVADEAGLDLVRVDGNFKDVFLPYVSWRMYAGLLPGLALLHAPAVGSVLFSSNEDIGNLGPWATHPVQEPMFSTASLTIRVEPVWTTRLDKIAGLVTWPFAMRHLRVCWTSAENCGCCNKCVRTILALMALGREDCAVAFPRSSVPPAEVTNAMRTEPISVSYFDEIAYRLVEDGRLPEYVAAIEAGRIPAPAPVTKAHALAVLAPEPVRRAVRRLRGGPGDPR